MLLYAGAVVLFFAATRTGCADLLGRAVAPNSSISVKRTFIAVVLVAGRKASKVSFFAPLPLLLHQQRSRCRIPGEIRVPPCSFLFLLVFSLVPCPFLGSELLYIASAAPADRPETGVKIALRTLC